MGWLFTPGSTLKSLLRERCDGWVNDKTPGKRVEATCLRRCFKGNPAYKGHLWTVWEIKQFDVPEGAAPVLTKTDRFIGCDILEYSRRDQGWGYKDMDESIGPHYYDCPIAYLDMVPQPEGEFAGKWRETVRERAAKRSKNRKMVNALKPGDRLRLVNCSIPEVTITSIRPLRGTYGGMTYNIPGRMIGEKIEEEDAHAQVQG